ncbi:hypothetical protein E2C01_041088 [Portunus trituberculatus]|uniref:Uncharacterized protein n=1 Tax=Portunus trituberculatus TaxID=210409 RepID=A0A5B7FPG2_PORTR|nr:hypothetical protein [Portunus trituberculatus]
MTPPATPGSPDWGGQTVLVTTTPTLFVASHRKWRTQGWLNLTLQHQGRHWKGPSFPLVIATSSSSTSEMLWPRMSSRTSTIEQQTLTLSTASASRSLP